MQDIQDCNCDMVHTDVIETVLQAMPEETILYDMAELFKVFGDTTRIKLLWALHNAELCVCDVAALLGMTKSAVSHQLKVLRQAKLVTSRKEGKNVFYSLDDEHVHQIFEMGLIHINEGRGAQ